MARCYASSTSTCGGRRAARPAPERRRGLVRCRASTLIREFWGGRWDATSGDRGYCVSDAETLSSSAAPPDIGQVGKYNLGRYLLVGLEQAEEGIRTLNPRFTKADMGEPKTS